MELDNLIAGIVEAACLAELVSRSNSTVFIDGPARHLAVQSARGSYQRSLLTGGSNWSGSDLRGKANRYGGRYRASRDSLVRRLRGLGLQVTFLRVREQGGIQVAGNGRIVAVITSNA